LYANPAKYGAEIVSRVLSDPALMEEWWDLYHRSKQTNKWDRTKYRSLNNIFLFTVSCNLVLISIIAKIITLQTARKQPSLYIKQYLSTTSIDSEMLHILMLSWWLNSIKSSK
jgi:hypothetical protein